MAVLSTRRIVITLGNDLSANLEFIALNNASSPGVMSFIDLALGDNVVELPLGSVRAATIIPPVDNIESITLKGDAADVGIELHPTDPFTITFPEVPAPSFVLNASDIIVGLRIIWT